MTEKENTNEQKQSRKRGQRRGKPRRKGSGSVFRRPDRKGGKEWIAQINLEEGKTKQRYFKTQAEADIALTEMLYEQRRGMLATGPQQTVKQFMEYWLEDVSKPAIRLSSYIRYRGILDKHILPLLGHVQLQKLTVQEVEKFYAQLAKKGLSAKTIKMAHAVLHKGLAHAVYLNLVARNVCDIAKKSLPRQTRFEIQPLTQEQAQKLLEQAHGEPLETLLILAITTGMRRGELLALRWSDVHFEERYLQVSHSARYAGRAGYGILVSEPKTVSGRRKILLSSLLVDVLTQHRISQQAARNVAGKAWKEHGLVFCDEHGEYLSPNRPLRWLKKLLEDAGLPPMRFHDLRHSAATFLLVMGVHVKVVQELLGHSDIVTTLNIYSHVLPTIQQDAMDKLSGLFDLESGEKKRKDNANDAKEDEEGK
jgi:integrase